MDEQKKAFVTGWPIEHSRSPLIHRYWLKQFGISGDYVKYPCRPEDFDTFLSTLSDSGFVGGNVTIPHKEAAHRLCKSLDSAAQRMGAVNTVWLENGILSGANTDGYGFLANLDEQAKGWDKASNQERGALVLGAGGSSRAIVDGLVNRGFKSITIANRTEEKAKILAKQFGPVARSAGTAGFDQLSRNAALIVNTTSVGMNGINAPVDLSIFRGDTTVNDIIYTPLETPLLAQAAQLGMKPVDGLGMLLHQAVPGFEKWFGHRPVVTQDLRNLIIASLDAG